MDCLSEITILPLSGKNERLCNEGSLVFSRGPLDIRRLFGGMLVFFKFLHSKNTFLPLESTNSRAYLVFSKTFKMSKYLFTP